MYMPLNINNNIIDTNDITNIGVFTKRINTDSLICYLDAGNLNSYPGTGTVWYDLSGKGNNFTLSGVTFTGGTMSFNGTSNYAKSISTLNLLSYSYVTVEVFFKPANTNAGFIFEHSSNWNTYQGGFGLLINHNGTNPAANTHHTNHSTEKSLNYSYTIGTNWSYHLNTFSKVSDLGRVVYVNNIYLTGTTTLSGGTLRNENMYIGARGGTTLFFNGQISTIRIYANKLSPYQISENFQAQRGRFNL